MGAKVSYTKGAPVLVKVPDGRGGHTLQSGKIKDTAGRGAIVRFTNGGHERFVFATEISPDTTEPVKAKPDSKVQAPAQFAPKAQPSIGQLFRAERASRELHIVEVASMLGISSVELIAFEDGQDTPSDDLVLKFADVIGANVSALVDALARDRAAAPRVKPAPIAAPAVPTVETRAIAKVPEATITDWAKRLRAMALAIGVDNQTDIVITHRSPANADEAWKVALGKFSAVGKTAEGTMGHLTDQLNGSIAERIAARRKELADLESLSAGVAR